MSAKIIWNFFYWNPLTMLIHCMLWKEKKALWPAEISCSLKKKNWTSSTACNIRNVGNIWSILEIYSNTSKINPSTVLEQEVTYEDHNYCEHCNWNRSDSPWALTRASVCFFSEACCFTRACQSMTSDWLTELGQKIDAASDALLLLCSDWELCSSRSQSALLRHSKKEQ